MESFKGKPRFRFDGKIGLLLQGQFREPCFPESGYSGGLKSEHEDTMCRGKARFTVECFSSEAGTVVSELDFFGVGERMTRIVLGERLPRCFSFPLEVPSEHLAVVDNHRLGAPKEFQ